MKYLSNSYIQIRTLLLLAISVLIITGCGGGGGSTPTSNGTNSLRSEELRSITISSANQTVHLGTTEQFTAVGHYANGESADITADVAWLSSDSSKATISNESGTKGLVTPVAVGTTNITAAYGEISSDPSSLTISSATLNKVVINPENTTTPLGLDVQFTLVGIYSDKTNQKITSGVTWKTEYPSIATISESGLATPVAVGVTKVMATYNGLSAEATLGVNEAKLNKIVIDPQNAKAPVGMQVTYTATGVYSDGKNRPISKGTWTSSAPEVASIGSTTGVATALVEGKTNITVTFDGLTATTKLEVNAAQLSELIIASTNDTSPRGVEVHYTATGRYTDGQLHDLTGQVLWHSSESSVATINNAGVATPRTVGDTKISATSGSISSNSLNLKVTAEILSQIIIEPAHTTTPVGLEVQYTATGIYSDGSHQTLSSGNGLTWSTSDSSVATIDDSGKVITVSTGTATIKATFTSSSGSGEAYTSLNVSDATLQSVVIDQANVTTPLGVTVQYTLTGIYSDNSHKPITSGVIWDSGSTNIATIDPTTGLATPVATGTANITASFGNYSDTTSLTVDDATLSSIIIDPADTLTPLGVSVQYKATGVYSDGKRLSLSNVTWSSGSSDIATIDSTTGLATPGTTTGKTTITATSGGVSATTNLIVTAATLTHIIVEPPNASTHMGVNAKFVAFAVYSDSSSHNITSAATWVSGNQLIATIDPSTGIATPVAVGTTNITATYNGLSSTATLTVKEAQLTDLAVTPVNTTTPLGVPVHYTATATYSDGKHQDVTSAATWTSGTTSAATINTQTGVAAPVAVGKTEIQAAFGGKTATTSLEVTNATLTSINVTPSDSTGYVGVKYQFKATGVYSDQTHVDLTKSVAWSVSTSHASIDANGLLTALDKGSTQVRAIQPGGTVTGETSLTIDNSVSYKNISGYYVTPNTGINAHLYNLYSDRILTVFINKSDNHIYDTDFFTNSYSWFGPSLVGDPSELMTTKFGLTTGALTPATSRNYPKVQWVAYEDASQNKIVVTIANEFGGPSLPVLSGRSPSMAFDPRFDRMCLAYHDMANQDVELKCIVEKTPGVYGWEYYNVDEGRQVAGSKDKDHRSVNVHLIFGNTQINAATTMPIISFDDPSTRKVVVKMLNYTASSNAPYTPEWQKLCGSDFGSEFPAREHDIALQTDKTSINIISHLYVAYTDTSNNLRVSRCEPTVNSTKQWEFGNVIGASESAISIAANPLHMYVASRGSDGVLKLRSSTLFEFPKWQSFPGMSSTSAPQAPTIRNSPYSTKVVIDSRGIPYVNYVTDLDGLGMMAGKTVGY